MSEHRSSGHSGQTLSAADRISCSTMSHYHFPRIIAPFRAQLRAARLSGADKEAAISCCGPALGDKSLSLHRQKENITAG